MNVQDIAEADLAALKDQGYTENDLSQLAASEVQSLLPSGGDDDDDTGDQGGDRHAAAAAEQDANAAAEAEDAPAPASQSFVPEYTAEVPADAAAQIKAFKDEERGAFKRLMDGEIDADEYQAIKDEAEAKADALKEASLKATIFRDANAQAAEQAARNEWKRAETALMADFKAEGLDYKAKPSLLQAYNFNLKALGADPKNENRDARWFLAEAHRVTKADLGIVTTKRAGGKPFARDEVGELPPTLRAVPAAATGAVNSDEFAHMRNLDGIALERAHAALTEAQRERWMAE